MSRPCIIFDLDDTLFLERDYVQSGFDAVGRWADKTLGLPGFATAAWACFQEGHRGQVFNKVLVQHGRQPDPSVISAMVEVYRSHRPSIRLLTDALECIELFQHRAVMGVVTDGPLKMQRNKVEALGIEHCMRCIVFTDIWGRDFYKPHTRAFVHVQSELGTTHERCVYVADNPIKDFIGPKRLGWRTVRIRRKFGLHVNIDSVPEESADFEFADLSPMSSLIDEF